MFSCLQILEAFLWFVLITLLNVTLIILTLSVSRLLNRSEERFSRNAETELVCRLLLEKKKKKRFDITTTPHQPVQRPKGDPCQAKERLSGHSVTIGTCRVMVC